MPNEVKYNRKEVMALDNFTKNGIIEAINHPVGEDEYLMCTVVHLHIKDAEVMSYDIIHCGLNNTHWVEDFTGMSPIFLWRWLNEPLAVNFYGELEIRKMANLFT